MDFVYNSIISFKEFIYKYNNKTLIMEENDKKKKVLVIGGGYGGSQVCKELDSTKFDVTLIERKNLFFHNIASVRAVVDSSLLGKIFMPYESLLKNGKLVNGTVKEVSPTQVTLEDGQNFNFDYLVIATGSNSLGPWKAPLEIVGKEAKTYYESISNQIKHAKKVLIVGGGSVGVELIGEISHVYNGKSDNYAAKEITLVHSSDKLIGPKMNDKFHKRVYDAMKSRNVNVIFNDRIAMPDQVKTAMTNQSLPTPPIHQVSQQTYTTENGKKIDADLLIWTIGSKINNETYLKHFSNVTNENGQLLVNQHCQVQGYNNIFAVGDITDIQELKTCYNAAFHGTVVSKVITSLAKGKTTNLATHKPSPTILALSLGPNDGITQLPNGWVFGGFFTKNIKSKNMFINRYYELFNKPNHFNFD